MGKAKTQRTEALHQAARRYVIGKQAEQAIAQHNLDKLVAQGVIMTEPTSGDYTNGLHGRNSTDGNG